MSSKSEKDRAKQIQDRCQAILMQMLKDEDNKYCVDCDAKGPRWASWNLGIFLCIRCAGIHRNLGVHISKVKSVTLDSWTPEQVVSLQQMGNSRARAVYEANLPDAFRRPQTDSSLEAFIRSKYEQKRYIAKEWVPPVLPKINWDKEIEEEIEKQKRKKKTNLATLPAPLPTADSKSSKSVSIPQPLPKPKSSSPKPSHRSSSNSADLLGLTTNPVAAAAPPPKPVETNQDIFSNFFTSEEQPTIQKPEPSAVDDLKKEEASFFNQSTPTEQQKLKLTKDSILALYNQAPPINNVPNHYSQPNMSYNIGQFQPPVPSLSQAFAPNQSTGNAQQFNANYNRFVQQPFTNNSDGNYHSAVPSQQLTQQFGGLNLNQPMQTVFGAQHNTNSATNTMWQ